MDKGGELLVNGCQIDYSSDSRLLALDPFGDMQEIKLTESEAEIVRGSDGERIWNEVVLPRFYRIEGKERDGKRVGHWIFSDHQSRKAYEGDYHNGLRDGKWVYFFPSGALRAEIHFTKGKRNGKWIYFSEDGAVKDYLTWKDNVPVERPARQNGLNIRRCIAPDGTSQGSMGT